MTKTQAMAMNARFMSMDSTIKAYDTAYKFKYFQYNQATKTISSKDSVIAELNKQLLIKPTFRAMTKTDIVMSFLFSAFGIFLITNP